MKRFLPTIILAVMTLCTSGCNKPVPDGPEDPQGNKLDEEEFQSRKYVNTFAYNMMRTYYLWCDEISAALEGWKTNEDPVQKVKDIRYKDSTGKDIDRWTQMLEDYDSYVNIVNGVSTTYGMDYILYYYDSTKSTVCAVVTYVYNDSPAAKAGLKRGDCITAINGKAMTASNYSDLLQKEYNGSASVELTFHGGAKVKMDSVTMYEDPVLMYKIFNCPDKKVGYLAYTSFTRDSYLRLIEACKYFKQEGVTELVLDLRYNGGGQVTVENALASMLAPAEAVADKRVYETEVYNTKLAEVMGNSNTVFTTDFSFQADGKVIAYSTADANIGLGKIYALVGTGTASASESLITGLLKYTDIEIIGSQTHGKYCSGILYSAKDWYNDYKDQLDAETYTNGIKNCGKWGIYVMISRYADKDGVTPCMPDGFTPGYKVTDTPEDGIQLGDPQEALLKTALSHAGYSSARTASTDAPKTTVMESLPDDVQPRRPEFGVRIIPVTTRMPLPED